MNNIKKHTVLILLFIFSLPTTFSLFLPDFFSTHDGVTHVVRFLKFYENLSEGQWLPRWSNGIAFNLGSPVLIFNAPLPYFISSIFKFIGFSYSQSVEIVFALSLILSSFAFYIFAKDYGKLPAFVGSLVYLWAPYRFVDIYVRGALPESFTFIFMPLILFAARKIISDFNYKWILLGVISLSGVILTHNVFALLLSGIFLFTPLLYFNKQYIAFNLVKIITTFLFSLLVTSFYWIPALFEKGYTNLDKLNDSPSFYTNFTTINKILYSPWNWGPVRSESPMSTQLGLTHWIIIFLIVSLILVYLLRLRIFNNLINLEILKKFKIEVIASLGTIFLSLFLMTDLSVLLWENIKLLSFFLYPWRFLSVAIFATAILSVILINISKNNKLLCVILIVLLMYSNRNHLQLVGSVTGNDEYYINYSDTTDMWGEFMAKSANLDFVYTCKVEKCMHPKIISDNDVNLTIIKDFNNILEFRYEVIRESKITINNYYFPQWQILLDNKKIDYSINNNGTLDIVVPSGSHNIVVELKETLLRTVARFISIFSAIFIIIFIWKRKYYF